MTKNQVNSFVETFVIKLRGVNTDNHVFYKQLPLNENENNFDVKLNDNNYKKIFRHFRDVG